MSITPQFAATEAELLKAYTKANDAHSVAAHEHRRSDTDMSALTIRGQPRREDNARHRLMGQAPALRCSALVRLFFL